MEMPDVRRLQILPVAGGWRPVIAQFQATQVALMRKFPHRSLILALDLDGDLDRLIEVRELIPEDLRSRVYVLGVRSEPETLQQLKRQSLEAWGADLAKGCHDVPNSPWSNAELAHNLLEIQRMQENGIVELLLSDTH